MTCLGISLTNSGSRIFQN